MGLTQIPKEILLEILSYLQDDGRSLVACSRVSRPLWELVAMTLYKNIDLEMGHELEDALPPVGHAEITQNRQKRLVRSLAENRELARVVSSFRNKTSNCTVDVAWSLPLDQLISAAANMTSLRCATLTANPLAAQIISSLQHYPHLVDLTIADLNPLDCIWDLRPTSLKRLTWTFSTKSTHHVELGDFLHTIRFLTSAVKHTCPLLTSLQINIAGNYWRQGRQHVLPCKVLQHLPAEALEEKIQRCQGVIATDVVLENLSHLGVEVEFSQANAEIHDFAKTLVCQHHHTLTSLCLSLNTSTPKQMISDILEISDKLKNLKELELMGEFPYENVLDLLKALMTNLSSRLERFTMVYVGSPFDAELGRSFGTWSSLKYLCLGDQDMTYSGYDDNGRPDFVNYKLMEFIKYLPRQLEELHLWIHGADLHFNSRERDYGLRPIRELAGPIFRTLRSLHTCDILAFLSNVDGCLAYNHPENAVHYRRLPHRSATSSCSQQNKIRDVWVSRMDTIYQREFPLVTHRCDTITLGDGDGCFEGDDAEDIWMGGPTGGTLNEQAVEKEFLEFSSQDDLDTCPDITWPRYKGIRYFKYPQYVRAGSSDGCGGGGWN